MFKNSSLVRCAARSTPALPTRPTAPSIAPFTSRAHQRRHSSSKPPVPPNNGSPTIPEGVKQVTPRSEAKTERKKPAERSSKKAAAKAEATEENWTSIFPSVPTTSHMSQKGMLVVVGLDKILTCADVNVAAFYATHRPISITGIKEAPLRDVEQIFTSKPSKSRAKQTNDVVLTLSSALENLNSHIAAADKQPAQSEEPPSPQKELFRVVDGSGNQFKVVGAQVQNAHRPFRPPPPPQPLSQAQLEALDRQDTSSEAVGEEALAAQLESQVQSQDPEAAAARGRRDRAKLDALFNPSDASKPAEIVFNTTMKTLKEKFSFFTPTEPAPVQEPQRGIRPGHRIRRGFVVRDPSKGKLVYKLISVKRQRKAKMKKHKYKKVSSNARGSESANC